jgi:hypothetical protein
MRAPGSATTRRWRLVVTALVATGVWGLPSIAGAQAEIPPEVRKALERNAQAFAPIALTLEKQRALPEQSSDLGKRIADIWYDFLWPHTAQYLSQDGLCSVRFHSYRGKEKFWQEFCWDGKYAYRGAESLRPQALTIMPKEKLATDREFTIVTWYDDDDYLGMIGIAVPRFMKELPEGIRSEVLHLLTGTGRLQETRKERAAGGAEYFVVELRSDGKKHRFWLDPSLGHAVRRHEVWADSGELAVIMDNSDFVKLTDPELWLPRHCHAEWHTWPIAADKEFSRETAVVVDVQATRLERARVPPERFTLKYDKPGSHVADAGLAGSDKDPLGRIEYTVPADPANLDEVIRAAQQGSGYVPPGRRLFVWIIVIGSALGAAAIGIVLIRRGRKRPTTD